MLHIGPWTLVEFIHSTGDRANLVFRHTAHSKDGIKNLAVIHLDCEAANVQCVQCLDQHTQALSIWDHRVVRASNIKITLIELAKPALGHGRLVPPVHLRNMVAFDVAVLGRVHRHETCERNR